MKKEYTKPLVTVISLIADRHIASVYNQSEEMGINESLLEDEE